MQTYKANSVRSAQRMPPAHDPATMPRRGRPPKKAFINVLVRTSTRASLTHLKATMGLPSQGAVIDFLVAELAKRRPASAPG